MSFRASRGTWADRWHEERSSSRPGPSLPLGMTYLSLRLELPDALFDDHLREVGDHFPGDVAHDLIGHELHHAASNAVDLLIGEIHAISTRWLRRRLFSLRFAFLRHRRPRRR